MGFQEVETIPPTALTSPAALEVIVLFTDVPSTLGALRTATQLVQGLAARVRLLVLHCVPYPLPLDQPPISLKFLGRHFRALVESCDVETSGRSVETTADVYLCRDQWETLRTRLTPHSVVVIGKRSHWWPRPEDQLARKLRAAGHHVVRTSLPKEFFHA